MTHLFFAFLLLAGWLNANHFSPWVSWHSEIPFFLLVMLVALVMVWRRDPRHITEIPSLLWLPLLLGLVMLVQGLFGLVDSPGQLFVVAMYLLTIATSIVWGRDQARQALDSGGIEKYLIGHWLAWSLVVGGVLSLAIALAQVLQLWEGVPVIARQAYIRRPGGNLAQPNHLATLLVMGIGSVLFLYIKRCIGRIVLGILVLVFTLGVAVTGSRSGLLATLVLWAFWAWKQPTMSSQKARMWALVPALNAIATFALWPPFYGWFAGGLDVSDAGLERFNASGEDPRRVLWRQMLQASLLKPWFGWGIGNSAQAHNAVADENISTLAATYSHNLILDMAVWVGWPIALGITAFMVMWIWCRLKEASGHSLSWFGMALLIPFGIHSLLEFPFAYAYLLVPAMLGAGYIEGVTPRGVHTWLVPRRTFAPLVSLFCIVGAWSIVDYVRVEEDFRIARFQMLRIGPPPTEPPPKILVLDQLSDLVASTRIPLQPDLDLKQMGLLRKAALHHPWSGSQYRYAMALALNSEPEEARRQMRVIWAQHGFKVYRPLAVQIEQELIRRGSPTLGLVLDKSQ